jgi:hypothetical protein
MRSLRPTDHTGSDRCWPCTAANVVVAVAIALAVATVSRPAAAVTLVAALGIVAYAGYLVPGTPALTRRFLPDRVLARFGKPRADPVDARPDGGGDAADRLVAAGALEAHDDGTLSLSSSFAASWREAVEALGDDPEAQRAELAAVLDVDPAAVRVERIDDTGALSVRLDDGGVSQWISRAALIADLAAGRALAARDPTWRDRPVTERHRALVGLRQFHGRCPACGGRIEDVPEATAGCCWTSHSVTARCEDCGDRLYVITEHPE